jgi:hypothetical protein
MFSLFYIIKKSLIYITILLGVVLVRTAPTAFHNVVVDDSAWIDYKLRMCRIFVLTKNLLQIQQVGVPRQCLRRYRFYQAVQGKGDWF